MAKKISLIISVLFFLVSPVLADEFAISFEWGDIPLCTNGAPNTVPNPKFILSNVPENTKFISFALTDLNSPTYNHGGGVVEYTGNNVIEPGAFKYQSPCPPNGSHRYEWTAKSKESNGFFSSAIGIAKSAKDYPEKN
jgi:hypothetical protein